MKVKKYLWSRTVREMAGYKCEYCGSTHRVEAHHIIPQSVNEDLALELENGIALCKRCHYSAHNLKYYPPGTCRSMPKIPLAEITEFIRKHQEETKILYFDVTKEEATRCREWCKSHDILFNDFLTGMVEDFIAKEAQDES